METALICGFVLLSILLSLVLYNKLQKLYQTELKLQAAETEKARLADKLIQKDIELSEYKSNEEQTHQLANILTPLKEQLNYFGKKITETYEKDLRDRTALEEQVKQLLSLNIKLSDEANRLTSALKGNVKTQGLWGEFILEQVLTSAGLREGYEYIKEGKNLQLTNDEGELQKPDIILNLPDGKHLIIDAKVSLIAYERAINELSLEEKNRALKEHINSLTRHIQNLSKKHYQANNKLNCPDLVLMFIPIEGALSLASESQPGLLQNAWDQKIILTSPTTLLATALTIASVWKFAYQNENAKSIAKQGAKLYDKICLFATELEKVGKHLDTALNHYQLAWNKLCHGKDNVLRNSEKLRELGIRTKHDLSPLLDSITAINGQPEHELRVD